eukprot:6532372-Pyramimonas_sp.AAC.1
MTAYARPQRAGVFFVNAGEANRCPPGAHVEATSVSSKTQSVLFKGAYPLPSRTIGSLRRFTPSSLAQLALFEGVYALPSHVLGSLRALQMLGVSSGNGVPPGWVSKTLPASPP